MSVNTPCFAIFRFLSLFRHLYGLVATDALISTLLEISGNPVPARLEHHRAQLQDAMLDTHFMLGQLRVAAAADPDQLNA